jgi:hypothetical protein
MPLAVDMILALELHSEHSTVTKGVF